MNDSPPLQNQVEPWRIWIFLLVTLIVLGVYIFRLFSLQVLEGAEWLAQADDNRTDTLSLSTQRGVIYDRNGTVLARNIASYNVVITAANLPDDEGAVPEIFRN